MFSASALAVSHRTLINSTQLLLFQQWISFPLIALKIRKIKVGQPVAQLPPHKSQRAELPHWAFQNCSLRTRFSFHLEAMTYMGFD